MKEVYTIARLEKIREYSGYAKSGTGGLTALSLLSCSSVSAGLCFTAYLVADAVNSWANKCLRDSVKINLGRLRNELGKDIGKKVE